MKNYPGFSLLELAIVLLVIALIIGGVVSGKSLIHSAELRSVLQEYDQYMKAAKEFTDKYQQLPGDYDSAETAWGTDGTCDTDYVASASASTATCDGNADGMVANCSEDLGATSGGCTDTQEAWRAWQHLSNAGFIEGKFTGRHGDSTNTVLTVAIPGINVPASKFKGGGWTFLHLINPRDRAWLSAGHYGHILLFGGGRGGRNGVFTTEPIVFTSDALEMDTKIDDGLPTTGTLRAWDDYWMPTSENGPTSGADSSASCVNTNQYFSTSSSATGPLYRCSLVFIVGY